MINSLVLHSVFVVSNDYTGRWDLAELEQMKENNISSEKHKEELKYGILKSKMTQNLMKGRKGYTRITEKKVLEQEIKGKVCMVKLQVS